MAEDRYDEEYGEDEHGRRPSRAWKIIKYVLTALLALTIGFLLFRMCQSASESVLKDITASDAMKAAYSADGELEILTNDMPYQISPNGYFSAYSLIYCPSAGEVQVTVKFNKSAYSRAEVGDGYPFSYTLVNEKTGEVFEASSVTCEEKGRYGYCRLSFSGVTIDSAMVYVTINSEDNKTEYDRLLVHDENQPFKSYRLSGSEKKALSE